MSFLTPKYVKDFIQWIYFQAVNAEDINSHLRCQNNDYMQAKISLERELNLIKSERDDLLRQKEALSGQLKNLDDLFEETKNNYVEDLKRIKQIIAEKVDRKKHDEIVGEQDDIIDRQEQLNKFLYHKLVAIIAFAQDQDKMLRELGYDLDYELSKYKETQEFVKGVLND